MKKINFLYPLFLPLLYSCSIMSHNTESVTPPPKTLSQSTPANLSTDTTTKFTPVNANTGANSSKSTKSAAAKRIQEQKDYGGEVKEVKVNNINNVPSYYIYPQGHGVDTNAPSSDSVSTPSWKLSW